MPKAARRSRASAHAPSAKPLKRQFAVQDNAVEHVDLGASADISGNEVLENLDGEPEQRMTKKEKQLLKHELFMQRLEASRSPYSKSHNRRLKRREKEQVGGGLETIKHAIAAVESGEATPSRSAPGDAEKVTADAPADEKRSARTRPGQIGEGKGAPLKRSQRKQALCVPFSSRRASIGQNTDNRGDRKAEQLRQPMIRSNPEFAANPFQTIRTHAQNTILQVKPS
ncbi:hypothetical protein EWM64_g232 [Hericium alpestre]|uniref:Ribosome biogenesis protein SLX9 n=1 Tax=Hericium alpestre TaxID=135208 RepID=A0A4Z0ABM7_9AGAM|nr:hypothetical protein EWM64_g232 [Hericium alpestre]